MTGILAVLLMIWGWIWLLVGVHLLANVRLRVFGTSFSISSLSAWSSTKSSPLSSALTIELGSVVVDNVGDGGREWRLCKGQLKWLVPYTELLWNSSFNDYAIHVYRNAFSFPSPHGFLTTSA
jgi:hypothetical protein